MDLDFSAADRAFRDQVRAFLDTHLTPDLRLAGRRMTSVYSEYDVAMKWHRILHAKGWVAPSWPREYGGPGWTAVQKYLFAREVAEAEAPAITPMGPLMCGPVLMRYGTPEQKARLLPRILSGEDFWCQGYSEPHAGSDLAALSAPAVDAGDHWLVSGTKIWTTHAHYANRMFCLVRTDATVKPQRGISFVLLDMTAPGVRVEPIVMMSGEHVQNRVFLDKVKVPKSDLVGAVNDGWTVAKYLLEFERGTAYAPSLQVAIARLRVMAAAEAADGARLIDDPAFRAEIDLLEIEVLAIAHTEHRVMAALSQGQNPGDAAPMLKIRGTETAQRISELGVAAVQHWAVPFQPDAIRPETNAAPIGPDHALTAVPRYLNYRAGTIYGGSSEIQRGLMARAVLGL